MPARHDNPLDGVEVLVFKEDDELVDTPLFSWSTPPGHPLPLVGDSISYSRIWHEVGKARVERQGRYTATVVSRHIHYQDDVSVSSLTRMTTVCLYVRDYSSDDDDTDDKG